jgi:hypothetical protein
MRREAKLTMNLVRKFSLAGLGLTILIGSCWSNLAHGAEEHHEVHFAHTPYELHVYRIHGRESGPTLLIIGGIQGNEPGGFLAADRYVDLTLERGNLILVPRANFYSILKNERGPDGDMNRRFVDAAPKNYVDRIVEIIKQLMSEADLLLNLHDGTGFYSPKWEGPRRNPMRYGQSIIADTATYVDEKRGMEINLEELALKVIQEVNRQISNERHHFLFNNHKTLEPNTRHPEQRSSATYYALTQFGIPAFGIETAKDIPDYRVRVQYQTMVINAFLKEVGIIPDHPPMAFDPPQLQYLLLSINQGLPVAVKDRATLLVGSGDVLQVKGVVSNYQRGITADIEGLGTENDIEKPLIMEKDTSILVRKESEVFGQVAVQVNGDGDTFSRGTEQVIKNPVLKYFVVETNGQTRLVENHGTLQIIQGDHLRLLDVIAEGLDSERIKVNFIGFVGDEKGNEGEDRGFTIHTAKDLWERYALDEEGTRYRVVALEGKTLLGEMVVALQPPRFSYLVIGQAGGPYSCYLEGSPIRANPLQELRILDIKTNVPDNKGVTLQVQGKAASLQEGEEGWILRLNDHVPDHAEIQVTREGIPMGRIQLLGPEGRVDAHSGD